MVLATMLYRASHLVAGFLAVSQHQRDRPVQWLVFGAALVCSFVVYAVARSSGWFNTKLVWTDVLLTGCVLPFLAYGWGGAQHTASIGWVMLAGGSASAAAAVALGRFAASGAVLLLAATHLVGYRAVGADTAVIVGHLSSLASSAVMAWVFWWYLRRQGGLLDAANERALAAEAGRARYAERIAHHRALHDTVLATLTTIASGAVDANSPQIRSRCGREAAGLRRLIQRTSDGGHHPDVGVALEEVVRSAECLGLRVTAQYHDLAKVPADVTAGLADAVTEALNNVRRHSGTGHAYLTATGEAGRLLVTVVDRGLGFDPGHVVKGLGLSRSVYARMREIGGRACVDSASGEGVRVELGWPG